MNSVIIDIRDKYKYINGHLDDAVNIMESNLIYNHNKYLNKNTIYYIYCDYGNRSKYVVSYLNSLGYNCVNIEGGYNNYLLEK